MFQPVGAIISSHFDNLQDKMIATSTSARDEWVVMNNWKDFTEKSHKIYLRTRDEGITWKHYVLPFHHHSYRVPRNLSEVPAKSGRRKVDSEPTLNSEEEHVNHIWSHLMMISTVTWFNVYFKPKKITSLSYPAVNLNARIDSFKFLILEYLFCDIK